MDEAEEKVFNIITEFTGEIGEYDVKLIARRIVEAMEFEKVEDNVVGEKYAIKMDLSKWEGSGRGLTNRKVYQIFLGAHDWWCFTDDAGNEILCYWLKYWGNPSKLNTGIAFELDKYKTKTNRFKIFMYVLLGYISILGFLSCIMFGEFIK